MMNGRRLFSAALTAGLVGFMSLAAVGEVTTIQLDEMEILTANRTYDITKYYITGPGGFELSNNATLTFNTAGTSTNDYEGGIIVNLGSALVSGTYNTYGTPFGKNPVITLHCEGTKRCQFKAGGHTIFKVITTGDSSAAYPVLNEGYMPTVISNIVVGGDLYMISDQLAGKGKYDTSVGFDFKNPVDAGEHDIGFSTHGIFQFREKVTCQNLRGYFTDGSQQANDWGLLGGVSLSATGNEIQHIILDSQYVRLYADNAINGATLRFEGQHECCSPPEDDSWDKDNKGHWSSTGYVNLNTDSKSTDAYTQTFKWIESDEREREKVYGYKIVSSAPKASTLVLLGEANKTADACVAINDKVNLEIAASAPASYKQIFRNRESTMTGTIAVRGGTLEIVGGATFSNATAVAVGGGATLVIGSDTVPFNDNIDLVLEGGATLTLSGDLKVKTLTLDGVAYPAGTYTEVAGTTLQGGAIEVAEGPACENPVFVYVPEGATVTNPAGLTDNARLFKMGGGTLVLTGANDFTGGSELHCGVIEMQDTAALGSGLITVYGSQDHESCLVFDKDGMTVANDILVAGNSTTNHPAVRFETTTTLSGTVNADGNFYFATGFENDPSFATESKVIFNGQVTVAEGGRIAAAPHCQVQFRAGLVTPILEGFWMPGAAANGGNAGRFLANKGVDVYTYQIGRIILDQTSFQCGNASVANGAVVEFTGDHPENGYGYFDINGTAQTLGGVYTGEKCKDATEGLQIMNSRASTTAPSP